jgi:aerobic carbon-monoxide dehydrogenase small subunit
MSAVIEFELNGKPVRIAAPETRRAIDLLREDLHLTGSKEGCGTGECGACSMLVGDEIRLACLMLAGQLAGRRVTTVEGLPHSALGAQLLRAFAEAGAVQCGYCIPGMEMAAFDLLRREADPSRERIREALSGNLCRCTGYVKIVDAVRLAAAGDDSPESPASGAAA